MINKMDLIEFTKEDIDKRVKIAQANMEKNGLSGMILSDESNLNYFSNFCTHAPRTTFTRPTFIFIPKKGKPVLLAQTFLAPEAEIISKGSCEVRGFNSLLGPTPKELGALVRELGMQDGNIGMELGFEQRLGFQVDTYEALKKEIGSGKLVDAANVIWSQRLIKSEKEIECHRRACQATSYAHDHVFDVIHKGMSEFDVARLTQQFMLEGGAEYPGFVIITSGSENYPRISKTSTNRKLEDGDFLWLDLGARYRNYWSDFCRGGIVGKIDPRREKLHYDIHELTMRASEVMKPGVPVAEVARACATELERMGYPASFDCGRMGHGMGLMSTEPPSVTIYDDTILEEGMIINLEPGVVDNTGVFDQEENFVITKDGCECLSGGSHKIHYIK